MSQAVAYGSISIIDVTDLGELSVQPTSNLPLTVVYDPNQSSFTPNWGTTNLVLTPIIYYGGTPLTAGTTAGLSVGWTRQVGSGTPGAITTGETIGNDGKLTVSANKFTSSSTMITYIVTATYVEPTSGATLTAVGQITFTMVKHATNLQNISIVGDSIFKYDTSQTLVGASSITLTANVTGTSIYQWQYQTSNGFAQYPNSGTSTTLTVNATDDVFINDKCVIRVVNDANATIYDLHVITKLRDGAAGSTTVAAVLTNDDQMLPASNGHVSDYGTAVSRIIIYEGGTDVTDQWSKSVSKSPSTITVVQSQNGSASNTGDTVSVTNIPDDVTSCTVTFTCTRSGYNAIVKTFSVVKVEAGADGESPTIFSVEPDTYVINRNTINELTPETITFRSFSQHETTKAAYAGRFQLFANITLSEYDAASPKPTALYTSSSNESSYTYSYSGVSASTLESLLCILYEAGATTNRLDSQQVMVVSDGAQGVTGATGSAGASAVNVVFGNYADVLPCDNANKLLAAYTITIPFAAYEGTTRIACAGPTANTIQLFGITPVVTNATNQSDGSIVWSIPAATTIAGANDAPSGVLNLTFTASTSGGSRNVVETYSWSRNTAAANAVLLQIYAPSGNIFNQDTSSLTLQGALLDGSTDVTSSASYQWAKFQSGSYSNVSGATSSSITISSSSVSSYAAYRLTATYPTGGTKTYVAYFSVFDKTDPIQVAVLSSVGTQLVNGRGYGAIYAKVSRNGIEIDAMKTERFLEANPVSAILNDMYYKIDKTNKALSLMKYNGSSWAAVSGSQYTGTYTWSWRDKNGEPITTWKDSSNNTHNLPTSGKVLYIDGDMIDSKIVADVEVTI